MTSHDQLEVPIIRMRRRHKLARRSRIFLAGASAVQIGTAVADDIEVFQSVTKGVETYLRKKNTRSVKDIVGLAHRK